jgi:hypothetical protein
MEVQSMILAPTGCQFSFQMAPNLVNYDYIFKILIAEWFWSFEILIISHLNSKFIKIWWLNKCDFLKHLWFLDVLFCCDFLLSFCCDFTWPFVISFDRLWFCMKICDFIKILWFSMTFVISWCLFFTVLTVKNRMWNLKE